MRAHRDGERSTANPRHATENIANVSRHLAVIAIAIAIALWFEFILMFFFFGGETLPVAYLREARK